MKNGESRVLIRIGSMNRPFRSSIFMDAPSEKELPLKWEINDWETIGQTCFSGPLRREAVNDAALPKIDKRPLRVMTAR